MQSTELLLVWSGIYAADLARYALAAGAVWLVLWKWFRDTLGPRRLDPDYPDPMQIRREIRNSMLTVLIFSATGFVVWLMHQAGWTRIYTGVAEFGWGYWLASVVLIVIAHDAYFYWTHRLLHTPLLFGRIHAVHHGSRNPSPWAAYSFHPFEAFIQAAFLPLVVAVVPVHASAIFLFTLHMVVRNCLGHSGTEIFPLDAAKRGWAYWSTTVTHHHLHHARARGNFGLYFSWWDRLCGTEDPLYPRVWDAAPATGGAQ